MGIGERGDGEWEEGGWGREGDWGEGGWGRKGDWGEGGWGREGEWEEDGGRVNQLLIYSQGHFRWISHCIWHP